MRVRDWALSGRARAYRQTVITSSVATPELAAAFATSAVEDERLLQRLVEEGGVYGGPLAAEAVRYRLGKKGVLTRWMDEHAADGSGGGA